MATTVDEYGNIVDEYDYAQENIPDYLQGYEFDDVIELSDGTSLSIADIYSDPSRAFDKITTTEDAEVTLAGIAKQFGETIANGVKSLIIKDGKLNTSGLATAGIALYGLLGGNEKKYDSAGYTKPVPTLTATRAQVPYAADPNRRPGEGGRQYFTDVQYAAPADTAAAQTAATTAAQGIASKYVPKAAAAPTANIIPISWNPEYAEISKTPTENQTVPASGVASLLPVPAAGQQQYTQPQTAQLMPFGEPEPIAYAHGGIAAMAKGRYLSGKTDGMADELSTSIDGEQPAALSHGEFVIPADVVSHLGNGNSEAGAEKLYSMMDRIRKARTGTTEQGKKINPENFMPGGKVGYADGGAVGGGLSSSLSPWAGDYVTGMLGKTQALANAPQQTYGGPLTAGASDLQQKSFAGIGALAQSGYTPNKFQTQYSTPGIGTETQFTNKYEAPEGLTGSATQFTNQFQIPQAYNAAEFTTGKFGNQEAQQYMNPYLQSSLNPQLEAMRREADIQRVARAGKMAQSGAFGGTRHAVEDALGTESLQRQQAQTIGTGYNTAYQQGMAQFNADQARQLQAQQGTEQSRQYGAGQGLSAAQSAAQYGQSAQAAQEQARQSGLSQLLSSAQSKAQYGQSAQAAQEQARQFGIGQQASQAQIAAQYGQAAAEATEASRRASSEYGLKSLGEMSRLGETQRGIEGEGIAAEQRQFEEQRDYPAAMLKFQRDMLTGLPLSPQKSTESTTGITNLTGSISGAQSVIDALKKLGVPI